MALWLQRTHTHTHSWSSLGSGPLREGSLQPFLSDILLAHIPPARRLSVPKHKGHCTNGHCVSHTTRSARAGQISSAGPGPGLSSWVGCSVSAGCTVHGLHIERNLVVVSCLGHPQEPCHWDQGGPGDKSPSGKKKQTLAAAKASGQETRFLILDELM